MRGQSLVEFALIAPILLLLLAAGTEFARVFFITTQVTDATREGSLYAVQHGNDPGQTQLKLDGQIRAVIVNAEQGGFSPMKCHSWSNPPTATQVVTNYSPAAVPPAPGTATVVMIRSTCAITSLFGFPGVPSTYNTATEVDSVIVPAS